MINPVVATPERIIHFAFYDVVVDSFWLLKNRAHIESPYFEARMQYWEEWSEFFADPTWDEMTDAQRDLYDTTYWKHPPTLELPERAQSLAEWSHCIFCGFPLNGTVTLFDCDAIREQGFEWRHVL